MLSGRDVEIKVLMYEYYASTLTTEKTTFSALFIGLGLLREMASQPTQHTVVFL